MYFESKQNKLDHNTVTYCIFFSSALFFITFFKKIAICGREKSFFNLPSRESLSESFATVSVDSVNFCFFADLFSVYYSMFYFFWYFLFVAVCYLDPLILASMQHNYLCNSLALYLLSWLIVKNNFIHIFTVLDFVFRFKNSKWNSLHTPQLL